MQTLCSAWSGAQMGQLNASVETKRIVPAGKRRVAATINIQSGNSHMLLAWRTGPAAADPVRLGARAGPRARRRPARAVRPGVTADAGRAVRARRRRRDPRPVARRAAPVMSGKLILGHLDGHSAAAPAQGGGAARPRRRTPGTSRWSIGASPSRCGGFEAGAGPRRPDRLGRGTASPVSAPSVADRASSNAAARSTSRSTSARRSPPGAAARRGGR